MSVLWIVIPLAFVFAGLAIAAFMWTVRSGQMDDLETPASRILFEDDETKVKRPTDKNSK
mgnify:FL=1